MNTPRRIARTLAIGLFLVPPLAAQEPEPRPITLDEAMELFATNNLELRLARAEAAEAAGLARQAAAYPNPVLSGSHEPVSGGGQSYSETYLNLSQRLEWPGVRGSRRAAADRAAAAARARLASDSARLAFEVKRVYTDAARAAAVVSVLERVTAVFREGAASASARYEEGDLSRYDFRRIRVERTRYENRLAEARLEAAAARRRLATLVAPGADALELAPADGLAGSPPGVELMRALDRAMASRPELTAAESALASSQAGADAVRGERIPTLTATGGYKTQSDGFAGVFLGLSLPVPLWDRRAGAVEAAGARVTAAESRATLVRRQVVTDVRQAVETYRSLQARAALLEAPADRGLAEDSGDLLEMARVAYAEGELELIELLDAAEALLDAEAAAARLRAALWIGYYDVERAVGGLDGPGNDENEGEDR